jgi:hypothetical protein
MNDLSFLEEYLAEQPAPVESSSTSIENMIAASDPDNSPLNVEPGEKVENAIIENKKKAGLLQTKKNTEKVLGAAVPTLDDFPVPAGGIALLLFIALLMVFAITKPQGAADTRLKLVWGAILGNYSFNQSAGGVNQTNASPGGMPIQDLAHYVQGVY